MAILSGVGNTFLFLDGLLGGVFATGKELKETIETGDNMGKLQSTVEHTRSYLDETNTIATVTDAGTSYAVKYAKYLPFTVNEKAVNFLQGITTTQLLSGVGIAISALTIIISSISIYRQNEILAVIPEELNDLSGTLSALNDINYTTLKKMLPEHLKTRIVGLGDTTALADLKGKVDLNESDAITIGTALVKDIQDYVSRKRVVEILTLLGGIIALTASVGLLAGCPPLALTVLAVAGLALTIACFAMSKGWVENPEAGFNWKLLLPEFIRSRLADSINAQQGAAPNLQVVTANAAVAGASAPSVSQGTPSTLPAAAPAQEKTSIWKKAIDGFMSFFKKSDTVLLP